MYVRRGVRRGVRLQLRQHLEAITGGALRNKFSSSYFISRGLNRILFYEKECQMNHNNGMITTTIASHDYRYQHICEILKLSNGENIRVGIVNKGITDKAICQSITSDNILIHIGPITELTLPPRPTIDLILGIPRPRLLPNILSTISCLGINQLFLIKSAKVDKNYMSSHYFRETEIFDKALLEGLMQSNIDCWLPRYHIYRNMKDFQSDLKNIYSQEDNQILKILAHPSKLKEAEDSNYRHRKRFLEMRVGEKEDHDRTTTSTNDPVPSQSITHLIPTISSMESPKRIVIGIGPDGGWTDDELHFFHINQFHFVNLGNRILRTDMAVIAMVTIVQTAQQW